MKVELFDRKPDGMQMTAAGEILLADLQEAMLGHNRARNAISALKGMQGGHVILGVVECLAADFAPDLLADLATAFPGLSFDLRIGRTAELSDRLAKGELDVILAFNVPTFAEIITEHISHWPVGLVSHQKTGEGDIALEEVSNLPLVQLEQSFGVQASLTEMMNRKGFQPRLIGQCNSIAAVKGLVRRGRGAAILTRLDVYRELTLKELHFRAIDAEMPLTEPLSLCVARNRKLLFDRDAVLARIIGRLEALMMNE